MTKPATVVVGDAWTIPGDAPRPVKIRRLAKPVVLPFCIPDAAVLVQRVQQAASSVGPVRRGRNLA